MVEVAQARELAAVARKGIEPPDNHRVEVEEYAALALREQAALEHVELAPPLLQVGR